MGVDSLFRVYILLYLIFLVVTRGDTDSFCDVGVYYETEISYKHIPRRTFPQAEACALRRSGGGKGHGGSFV